MLDSTDLRRFWQHVAVTDDPDGFSGAAMCESSDAEVDHTLGYDDAHVFRCLSHPSVPVPRDRPDDAVLSAAGVDPWLDTVRAADPTDVKD